MQNAQPSLFTRSDTILGACEGIGEDFGFNPQYLRVALAGLLFWSPLAAFGIYAVLALAVFTARRLYPAVSTSASPELVDAGSPALRGENDGASVELAAAA